MGESSAQSGQGIVAHATLTRRQWLGSRIHDLNLWDLPSLAVRTQLGCGTFAGQPGGLTPSLLVLQSPEHLAF
jgi:hypothetical protein